MGNLHPQRVWVPDFKEFGWVVGEGVDWLKCDAIRSEKTALSHRVGSFTGSSDPLLSAIAKKQINTVLSSYS